MVVFWVEGYDTVLDVAGQIVYQVVSEHEPIRRFSISRGDRVADSGSVVWGPKACWIISRSVVHDRSRRCGESRRANGGR